MKNSNKKIEPAIEVKNVTVGYDGQPVLQNLSFDIERKSITAIIGPNGAGKTTLLRVMLNLIPIQKGEITILGQPHNKQCRHLRGHHLGCFHPGYVPQRYSFDSTFPITVEEFLSLALLPGQGKNKIDQVLKEIGMQKSKHKLLGQLSGGQVQRVLIAKAIVTEPEILFLDEPAYGIDIAGEKTFYDLIKHLNEKHGLTCVLVSHELDVVYKYADKVVCLNKKMICEGAPKHTLTAEALKQIYGKDVGIYEHA